MVRQPNLQQVAAGIRDIVAACQATPLSHQKSLNVTAKLFGFKNWAHYERERKQSALEATVETPVVQPQVEQSVADSLYETLDWVAKNYASTLAGKPVRDADECLSSANRLLSAWRKDVPAAPPVRSFTLITEANAVGNDFGEHPYWVELTVSQELVDKVLELQALCARGKLSDAATGWYCDNWDRGEEFRMKGEELVVSGNYWYVRAYPKHCDYSVETRAMSIEALLQAVESSRTGTRPGWTAFRWHGDVLLYSASGDTQSLLDTLLDDGVLTDDEDSNGEKK